MKSSKPRVGRTRKRTANSPAAPDLPKAALKIPPILLEGDESEPTPIPGSGQKHSLGASPAVERPVSENRELPEAYGTARLLLMPRDPRSLYAHWDLTSAQQRHHNSLAAEGHLILRVHQGRPIDLTAFELHVLPESRHWFIPVPAGAAAYRVELGYYDAAREWISVIASGWVSTPPETVSPDKSVQFATMAAGPSRPHRSKGTETCPMPSIPGPAGTLKLLAPPRVSWLPGLGSEPSEGPGSSAGAQEMVSAYDSGEIRVSEAWTLEQERALNGILALALAEEPAMSSLLLAQAAAVAGWLEPVSNPSGDLPYHVA